MKSHVLSHMPPSTSCTFYQPPVVVVTLIQRWLVQGNIIPSSFLRELGSQQGAVTWPLDAGGVAGDQDASRQNYVASFYQFVA